MCSRFKGWKACRLNFFCIQVQGSYYGEQEARLGYFPSSVVEETHALMPAEVEVKTNVCNAIFFFLYSFYILKKKNYLRMM